jgi:predicted transposase YbfD/YdcC
MRAVDEKSNEITAIPELLDLPAIKGAIVTIDAMHCQKKIAAKIIDKGADYVLRLKSNQGGLHEDVALLFSEQMENDFKNIRISTATDTDAGHGRIQSRQVFATDDIDWLKHRHDWAGLRSIVMVLCTRETDTGKSTERRFYIASLPAHAEKLGAAIRQHWGVENSLHWMLNVNFRDDAAASARKKPRQTSPPSSVPPSTPCARRQERIASNPSASSPHGTRNSSPKPSKTYEPIREVLSPDHCLVASRLSMRRTIARRTKAAALRAWRS